MTASIHKIYIYLFCVGGADLENRHFFSNKSNLSLFVSVTA